VRKIFFVAGETSGDAHGAAIIRALKARVPEIECEGLGGPRMAAAGMLLRHDLASEAIMGFTEVVKHFPAIRRIFLDTVAHIRALKPDVLVLIDYPGFNIRLAKALEDDPVRVVYYISPQVWAWKKGRVRDIAASVDHMLVIFPFEEAIYQEAGVPCTYVGHPLAEQLAGYEPPHDLGGDCVIGLLPGSRAQEIARHMPVIVAVARGIRCQYPDARFLVPVVDEKRAAQVRAAAEGFPMEVMVGGMHEVLAQARFALVASGTATLETALFGVPMVVLYKVSALSYALARLLVDVRHIGMVNIVAQRGIVPEFIQGRASAKHLLPAALELIGDTHARATMLADLAAVRARLGEGGASGRAAAVISNYLKAPDGQGCESVTSGLPGA
jgi:lipid-A-disaccharide synthase